MDLSTLSKRNITIVLTISLFLFNSIVNCEAALTVVDITPPEIKEVKIKDNPLELGQTVYIEAKIEDESGIFQALIEFDGENHTMLSKAANKWYFNSWTPNSIGSKPFTIYAEDFAKNWNQISTEFVVVPDNTAPNIIFVQEPEDEVKQSDNIPFIIVLNDSNNISLALLEFNSVNYTMENIPDTNVWRYDLTAPSDEGLYYYTIYIQDIYDNWNITTKTFEVISISSEENTDKDQNSNLKPNPFEDIFFITIFASIFISSGIITGALIIRKKSKLSPKTQREVDSLKQIEMKKGQESKIKTESEIQSSMKKIMIKCPVCHLSKEIAIPNDLVSETSGINTITIHKNVICPHTFQFFLDRTFEVRGYQQVDYEFEN